MTEENNSQWKPLTPVQRRVAGVLIEKSKTTPDSYPMSLNGVKTASNQKSNRSPKMDLPEHEVDETLYELRHMGAVIEVHSGGRVPKYKHQFYDWLGVSNVELAVMGELLLRGEQTLGDLRARASRMSKIDGMTELKPIIAELVEKNLVVELTPPGRGQVVTHNLYQPNELDRLKSEYESGSGSQPPKKSSTEKFAPETRTSNQIENNQKVESLESIVGELSRTVETLTEKLNAMGGKSGRDTEAA